MIKISDPNYNVSSLGAIMMIVGALLLVLLLIIALWVNVPDFFLKLLASIMFGGLFIAIIGLFIPHD